MRPFSKCDVARAMMRNISQHDWWAVDTDASTRISLPEEGKEQMLGEMQNGKETSLQSCKGREPLGDTSQLL